jgi:DNA-binding NtrC family response regulator
MSGSDAATILLVDDEDDYRHALALMLKRAGHRVIEAADSMAALAVLDRTEPIDAMIVDILMQKGKPHGFALANMAAHKRPRLKIVYVTVYY